MMIIVIQGTASSRFRVKTVATRTPVSRLKLSWTEETETARHVAHAERRQGGSVGSHVCGGAGE
jgi:hypothetical protein